MIEFRAIHMFSITCNIHPFPLIRKCYLWKRNNAHQALSTTLFEELILKRQKCVCICAHTSKFIYISCTHTIIANLYIFIPKELTKRSIQLFWNPTGNNQIITIFKCERWRRWMCVLSVNIRKMFLPKTHMNQIMPTHIHTTKDEENDGKDMNNGHR